MGKRVLLAIINNRKYVPMYFCQNIFELIDYSRVNGIKIDIRTFSAVEVQQMRNIACNFAIENNFDYIFMVDTDMQYPIDSIVRLISHDKNFVVGSATERYPPFYPTQYKKLNVKNFKDKLNRVFISDKDKNLIKIGFSGVVGALVKVDIFKKLSKPYFKVEYKKNNEDVIGSDIYFCNQLNKKRIKLYLDPQVQYKHEVLLFSSSVGVTT